MTRRLRRMQRHDGLPPGRDDRLRVQNRIQRPLAVLRRTHQDRGLVLLLHAVLRRRRDRRQEPDGQPPRGPRRVRLVLHGALASQARLRAHPRRLARRARPRHAPRARARRRRRARRVVARTREVRVLRGLPRHQPRRRASLGVQQPQRNPAVVVVLPGIRARRAEVLARGHRRRSLVLLLLDLRDLVGVLVRTRPVMGFSVCANQPTSFAEQPFPPSGLVFRSLLTRAGIPQEFRVARAGRDVVVLVFPR